MPALLSFSGLTRGKWVTLALCIFLFGSSYAQRYPANTYTIADGLDNSVVFDIAQDSSGLIWLATQSGISSYDGTEFINYGVNDSLDNAGYVQLITDRTGKLWALPKNTISRIAFFENGIWKLLPSGGFPNIHDRNISLCVAYIGNDPLLAVATALSGILVFHKGKWQKINLPEAFQKCALISVEINDGVLYAGTSSGILFSNDLLNIRLKELNTGCPAHNLLCMGFGTGNKLWMAGETWLGYYLNGKFSIATDKLSIRRNVNSGSYFMYISYNNEIYVGNNINLYCYSDKLNRLEQLTRDNGLVSDGATSVLCDRENNLWVSSHRGVTKIRSRSFSSFTKADGLTDPEIASAVEVSPGNFIFGHHGAVTYYNGKKFSSQILDNSTRKNWYEKRILDLVADNEGNTWASVSLLGVARINKNHKVKWYRAEQGITGKVNSIGLISDNRIICSAGRTLMQKKGDRFVPLELNIELPSQVRKIFRGKGDDYYLATVLGGLVEVKDGKATLCKSEGNSNGNNVYAVLTDVADRTWVGTLDGLYQKTGSKLKKVKEPGLSLNNPVYLILEDKLNRLWFGTNNGLFRWDGRKMTHFTVSDGLAGQEINRSAGVVDENNNLWIGTNNGLILYRPEYDDILEKVLPPKVRVTSVQAGKLTFNDDETIRLGSYNGDIVFSFRALSFIDRNQMQYKYKLEGLDKDWSKETRLLSNELRISNLSPGRYQFLIKVCNAYGIWSEPVRSPVIIISEPFWNRWWFISVIVLLIIGGLFAAVRYVFMLRTKNKLEILVGIRTRELSLSEDRLRNMNTAKDTFFSVISHDLRSPYNSLLGMLDILISDYDGFTDEKRLSLLKNIKASADRSFTLLDNLLTWARVQKGLIPCKPEVFQISDIIQENIHLLENSLYKKGIHVDFKVSGKINVYADKIMISTIVRNLVSNAVKFTYPGGNIDISVHRDGNHQVIFAITDSGEGISKKTQERLFRIDSRISTKGTSNETGTGMGLILCKEFIEMNNGRIWIKSELGSGSTFYFTLPSYSEN